MFLVGLGRPFTGLRFTQFAGLANPLRIALGAVYRPLAFRLALFGPHGRGALGALIDLCLDRVLFETTLQELLLFVRPFHGRSTRPAREQVREGRSVRGRGGRPVRACRPPLRIQGRETMLGLQGFHEGYRSKPGAK